MPRFNVEIRERAGEVWIEVIDFEKLTNFVCFPEDARQLRNRLNAAIGKLKEEGKV